MANFSYTASNNRGITLKGNVEAADRPGAIVLIRKQGLRPLSLNEVKKKTGFSFGGAHVKSDSLVVFTRELSAMVSAGVPLLRALTSLRDHSDSPVLKKILDAIIRDVEGGANLGDALDKYPDTFNSVYVNMVRAGEAAGILDEILKRLALQQEKNSTMRKKIKSAMTYPMVLVVITFLAFFGLMLFVIPQIGKIIKDLGGPDAELPVLTQIMLGISGFMINFWWLLIPAIAIGIFFLLRFLKTPRGRRLFHGFALKIPGVKTIVTKVAVARFARTFSALIGAGVAVLEALDVTARAVGNVLYEEVLLAAKDEVKNGASLSTVIGRSPLFPAIVPQMLAVGEETGQTDTVLVKVADFYEEEVDVAIDGLSSIIEPVMIVFMGTMVGLIAASVMLPIANLSQTIKN
jgi:type IV pilus assembly protein PilC